MTTASKTRTMASLGDRYTEVAVIVVTLVALLLGWVFMNSVVNRSIPFASGDISAQIPAGWHNLESAGNEILHVADSTTSGFATTYLIQQEAVPADLGVSGFVGLLTLDWGNSLTGFRVLDQEAVIVNGRDGVQIEYAYIEADPNLIHASLPAVVHGLAYIFIKDDQAVIVSYWADQSAFQTDLDRFYRFLASVSY
jgi:hypothetical protein